MALHIRDAETDFLVRTLAQRRRVSLTEAIKVATRNELQKDDNKPSLWERLKPVQDRIAARGSTGLEADKAFFDSLYEDD